ncbi:hypothetical protein BKI52_34880 [marine bacterium AO1-C]|nr:hypothetical protein BKI52_34880 [marine bacterium AO1-C]
MKNIIYIYFLLVASFAQAQSKKPVQITGQLFSQKDVVLKINKKSIKVSDQGAFRFTEQSAQPRFYDFQYGRMEWSMYLEPGARTKIQMPQKGLSFIQYEGDFTAENDFLKSTAQVNQKLSSYLRKNWVKIHRQDQEGFLSTIDSLKSFFLQPLKTSSDSKLSQRFIALYKADIHLSLNQLVLRYPEGHFRFTGKRVSLNKKSLAYLEQTPINQPSLLVLPSYKKFTQRWIDFKLAKAMSQMPEDLHSAHKKMQAMFTYLPNIIKNKELFDFWLTENFYQHLNKHAIVNGKQYLKQFNVTCKNPRYKGKINNYFADQLSQLKDHEVKIYKTEKGFAMEAHIFYPAGFDKKNKKPVIAIFHGGGWSKGTPKWAFGNARSYAKLGAIGIAVQYRLSNFEDVTPVESLQDTKDFFKWLRTNADELGVLPNKIAAEGWSAGGHLVTSAALFSNRQAKVNGAPNALILKSPALTAKDSWFKVVLADKKIAPEKLSPVHNVSANVKMPPTLILQGNVDRVTPLKVAEEFQTKMKSNQYSCDLVVYKGYGHMFTPAHIDDRGWPQPDQKIVKQAQEKANTFLEKLGFLSK